MIQFAFKGLFVIVVVFWYSTGVMRVINEYFRKEFKTYIEDELAHLRGTKDNQRASEIADDNVIENLISIQLNDKIMHPLEQIGDKPKHLIVTGEKSTSLSCDVNDAADVDSATCTRKFNEISIKDKSIHHSHNDIETYANHKLHHIDGKSKNIRMEQTAMECGTRQELEAICTANSQQTQFYGFENCIYDALDDDDDFDVDDENDI